MEWSVNLRPISFRFRSPFKAKVVLVHCAHKRDFDRFWEMWLPKITVQSVESWVRRPEPVACPIISFLLAYHLKAKAESFNWDTESHPDCLERECIAILCRCQSRVATQWQAHSNTLTITHTLASLIHWTNLPDKSNVYWQPTFIYGVARSFNNWEPIKTQRLDTLQGKDTQDFHLFSNYKKYNHVSTSNIRATMKKVACLLKVSR